MKWSPSLTLLLLASLLADSPAWGAKKRECGPDLAMLGHSSTIEWQPGSVDPRLAIATALLLNSAPNTWVVFARPAGQSIYQRGYAAGDYGTIVGKENLTEGADVALKILSGTMDATDNDFSILGKVSQSNTYLAGVNASYVYPFAVRGKFPEKLKATSNSLGAPDSSNHSIVLPGNKVTPSSIEAMGIFCMGQGDAADRYVWASNYLHLVNTLKEKGFRFSPGSEGESFYEAVSGIWADRTFMYGDSNPRTALPHELRNAGATNEALRQLFKRYDRKVETVIVPLKP